MPAGKGGKGYSKASKGGSTGNSGKRTTQDRSKTPHVRGSAGKSKFLDGARSRVTNYRVTGTLVDWRGGHGWIELDRPIDHPDASKHKGKVFMAHKDVEEEIDGVGATVSFFVYKDANGLGAEQVRPGRAKVVIPKYDRKPTPPARAPPAWSAKNKKEPGASAAAATSQARTGAFAQRARAKAMSQKEPKEPREQQPPDASSREVVLLEPVTGTCVRSFGQVAFIAPDQAIDHPLADQRKGSIYVHQQDVDGGEIPLPGAKVEFTVYSDEKGLGAENLRILSQGDGKQEAFGKNRRRDRKDQRKDQQQNQKRDVPVTKVVAKRGVQKVVKEEEKEVERKQQKGGKGKGRQRGGDRRPAAADKGPSGPNLPRERIADAAIVGEIVNWKRTFGWIKPAEDIDHELFAKHEGRIYIHKKDISGDDAKPEVGQTVQFYCYQDASGLGAEECMLL